MPCLKLLNFIAPGGEFELLPPNGGGMSSSRMKRKSRSIHKQGLHEKVKQPGTAKPVELKTQNKNQLAALTKMSTVLSIQF